MHGTNRIFSQNRHIRCPRFNRKARQPRRRHIERLNRQINSGRDNAALIGPALADQVKCCCRAKIENNRWQIMKVTRRHGINKTIGTSLIGPVNMNINAKANAAVTNDLRHNAKAARCQIDQFWLHLGHDAGNDHVGNIINSQ